MNTLLQNKDSTLADIREAIEIFPNSSNFLYIHGLTAYEAKLYSESGRSIERLLKQGDLNRALEVQLLGLLGDIRHHEQKYSESDSYFERALKLNPDDFTVLNNYAYFLSLRKQRLDTALIMIRKVVERQPNESAYADTYGWVLFQMGKYEEALKWVKRAYEAGASPEISEHLGDVYFRLNQPDEARRYWQKAREMGQTGVELDIKLKTGRIP
jgi:tetratricopeptide (TPR) repeat protein